MLPSSIIRAGEWYKEGKEAKREEEGAGEGSQIYTRGSRARLVLETKSACRRVVVGLLCSESQELGVMSCARWLSSIAAGRFCGGMTIADVIYRDVGQKRGARRNQTLLHNIFQAPAE